MLDGRHVYLLLHRVKIPVKDVVLVIFLGEEIGGQADAVEVVHYRLGIIVRLHGFQTQTLGIGDMTKLLGETLDTLGIGVILLDGTLGNGLEIVVPAKQERKGRDTALGDEVRLLAELGAQAVIILARIVILNGAEQESGRKAVTGT